MLNLWWRRDVEPTHASFFSGVGGLDLGLERAGWRTVSFSEIDPYANAVLAERWPGVPNLGDITVIAGPSRAGMEQPAGMEHGARHATLWSGGFPCQDLSVAGKRAGLAGARSGLAFAFLDLVERHRPPVILLENVPGLLSSHGGKDLGALLGRLGELGYWWAYRILDAQHFGVPQRRRRVFIVALNSQRGFGADSAAEVLSVGARCPRHPATGHATGEGVAEGAALGADWPQRTAWTLNTTDEHGTGSPERSDLNLVPISPPPDPGGVRAADGLAGGLDDLAPIPVIAAFVKNRRAGEQDASPESWSEGQLAPTVDSAGHGPRTATAILARPNLGAAESNASHIIQQPAQDLLPLGLDSHRYRCCGNGVVSSVAEWIGTRLRSTIEAAA
jgi:DNA-cytosine methyltransferase